MRLSETGLNRLEEGKGLLSCSQRGWEALLDLQQPNKSCQPTWVVSGQWGGASAPSKMHPYRFCTRGNCPTRYSYWSANDDIVPEYKEKCLQRDRTLIISYLICHNWIKSLATALIRRCQAIPECLVHGANSRPLTHATPKQLHCSTSWHMDLLFN